MVKIEEEFDEENYYIKEISIFLQNEPGRFYELIELLNEYDIYVKALSVVQASDFGLLAVIVNDPEECITVLKEYGYNITIADVLAVKMLDQTHSLINISKALSEKSVNIEYMYTALVKDLHLMIIRVNDKEKGLHSLQESGLELVLDTRL